MGLQLAYQLDSGGPVVVVLSIDTTVFPCASIVASASIGSIKPDLEDVPIVGQQLGELRTKHVYVFRCAIAGCVAIPG